MITWGSPVTAVIHPLLPLLFLLASAKFSTSSAFAALKDDGSVITWGPAVAIHPLPLLSPPASANLLRFCLSSTEGRRLRHHLGWQRWSSLLPLLFLLASAKSF